MIFKSLPAHILYALKCACPRCGQGHIFANRTTLSVINVCPHCQLPLAKNDSGDGPAVFMIFILGFLLVPLALWLDSVVHIPLWLHGLLWTGISLLICFFAMQPLKAYVIGLQFRHRPDTWEAE